mgnify:CR=1 FL=1
MSESIIVALINAFATVAAAYVSREAPPEEEPAPESFAAYVREQGGGKR